MKIKILFILIFLQACGHAQNFVDAEEADAAAPAQADDDTAASDNPPPPSDEVGACQSFVEAVVRTAYGEGAGFGQSRMPDVIFGPPQGGSQTLGSLHVVSLGGGGHIVVDLFPCEIVDGEGIDFIVFENAFYIGGDPQNPFAELAAVSVSEDGENFFNFPCASESFPYTGCAGWHPVLSHPNNAISPFDAEAAGGDPFDLADIGMERARYIRIDDLASSGGFPPSVGFDLDAIAVINGIQQQGGSL